MNYELLFRGEPKAKGQKPKAIHGYYMLKEKRHNVRQHPIHIPFIHFSPKFLCQLFAILAKNVLPLWLECKIGSYCRECSVYIRLRQ